MKELSTQLPKKAHPTDAGWDLSISDDMVFLDENTPQLVDLNFSIAIPEGYFGMIVPRSSMANKRILLANTVGIIDSGYRGNVKVALIYQPTSDMPSSVTLYEGDRVAQMIVIPHYSGEMIQVDDLDDTERGDGGFGSTGI